MRRVLASALIATVALVGCGGDDDDATSDGTTVSSTEETAAPSTTSAAGSDTTEPSADDGGEDLSYSGSGSPDVYEHISELANAGDCAGLQAEFDQAAENNEREEPGTSLFEVTLDYMNAADEALNDAGCYDD